MVCRAPSSVVPSPRFSFFPGPQLAAVRLDEGLAPRGLPQSCTCTTAVAYPRIGREHGITLAATKGTAPPTTATSAITSAATARATTAVTATREGDGHCYLLDTKAQCHRSVLPPLLSPPQNSYRRNQYEITKSTAKKDLCTSGRDFCTEVEGILYRNFCNLSNVTSTKRYS